MWFFFVIKYTIWGIIFLQFYDCFSYLAVIEAWLLFFTITLVVAVLYRYFSARNDFFKQNQTQNSENLESWLCLYSESEAQLRLSALTPFEQHLAFLSFLEFQIQFLNRLETELDDEILYEIFCLFNTDLERLVENILAIRLLVYVFF